MTPHFKSAHIWSIITFISLFFFHFSISFLHLKNPESGYRIHHNCSKTDPYIGNVPFYILKQISHNSALNFLLNGPKQSNILFFMGAQTGWIVVLPVIVRAWRTSSMLLLPERVRRTNETPKTKAARFSHINSSKTLTWAKFPLSALKHTSSTCFLWKTPLPGSLCFYGPQRLLTDKYQLTTKTSNQLVCVLL